GSVYSFDTAGKLVSVSDRYGNATRYLYDGAGRLDEVVDPVGLSTKLAYDGQYVLTITDPAGRVTTLGHDFAGNLTKITDPAVSPQPSLARGDGRHADTTPRGALPEHHTHMCGRPVEPDPPEGGVTQLRPRETHPFSAPPRTSAPGPPPVAPSAANRDMA